jgi:exonuclease SbcD
MRLIHLADLHLGFRAYDRLTPSGINQREADVSLTFSRVVDLLIARAPDLIIIGGDVFHFVKPTNSAIVHAMAEFSRLTAALPDTIVVMVGGNHDTPLNSETGSILPLFRGCGVYVAEARPMRFTFTNRSLSVLAVPDAFHERPSFTPHAPSRYNVAVAHLETAGLITNRAPERRALEVKLEELAADAFDYIGCGHYHTFRQLAPTACYSGSIDYTSSNIWGELAEERDAQLSGKVIVERDLDTGTQTLIPIPRSRPIVDLPAIDALGLDAPALNAAVFANAATVADGAIVRQVITNVRKSELRALDHKALRQLKARHAHYLIADRPPAVEARQPGAVRRVLPPVSEMLRARIQRNAEADGRDAAPVLALGAHYLEEADVLDANRQLPA